MVTPSLVPVFSSRSSPEAYPMSSSDSQTKIAFTLLAIITGAVLLGMAISLFGTTEGTARTPEPKANVLNISKPQLRGTLERTADFRFFSTTEPDGKTAITGVDPYEVAVMDAVGQGSNIEYTQILVNPYYQDQTYGAYLLLAFVSAVIPEWEDAVHWLYSSAVQIEQTGNAVLAIRHGCYVTMENFGNPGAYRLRIKITPA